MQFSNTQSVVSIDTLNLVETSLMESKASFEASSYIADNYNSIVNKIIALGIKPEKAKDLLHDLYVNLLIKEKEGEGFDDSYGDGRMSVEQFVFARINGYAKNDKYRTDIVDSKKSTVDRIVTVEDNDDFGTGKNKSRKVKVRDTIHYASIASTTLNDELEDNDGFQTAYSLAAVSDCSDDIDGALSLREQIETCIDICDLHDIKIINVFRNIDRLGEILTTKTSGGVFQKLQALVTQQDELANCLMQVLEYRKAHRDIFDDVLETIAG